jgi:hypothetical protein
MLGGPMSANLVVPFGWYSAVAAAQLTFLRFIFVIFPASASSKLVAAVLRLLSRTLLSLEGGAAAPRVEILVQSGRLTVAVLTAAVLLPSPPFVSPAQRPQEVVAVEVVSISVSAAVLASILVSGAASLRRRCGGGFSEAIPVPWSRFSLRLAGRLMSGRCFIAVEGVDIRRSVGGALAVAGALVLWDFPGVGRLAFIVKMTAWSISGGQIAHTHIFPTRFARCGIPMWPVVNRPVSSILLVWFLSAAATWCT